MFPIAAGIVDPHGPGGRPASWAATGRSGGVSTPPFDTLNLADYVGDDPAAVAANHARVAELLGLPATAVALMDSVHGADVAEADAAGVYPGVDGLVTQRSDLVIVALGADCVPLALVGRDDRTVAVAHCGWRGLTVDVVGAVVAAMEQRGSAVAHAVLGPSVCGRCYPVPDERVAEVRAHCSDAVVGAALVTCPDGQPGIDVRQGVRARLEQLGVGTDDIELAGGCTVEDPHLFSYRRDGRTGRQGIAIRRLARMAP